MFGLFKKKNNSGSELLSNVLIPQVRVLEAEGNKLHVNEVTFIYLMVALASLNGGKRVELDSIKSILDSALDGDEYRFKINNGYSIAVRISNFDELCGEILPIVTSDLSASNPTFLVRYTRYANEEIEKMFEKDFDPKARVRKPLSEI